MILELDMTSPEPLYQQIRDQIVLGLASQKIGPNAPLPSVRQLADDIGVNMMTVSKAYTLLKEQGYVATDRRQGTKIVDQITIRPDFETALTKKLTLLLAEATLQGISQDQLENLSRQIFHDFHREDK